MGVRHTYLACAGCDVSCETCGGCRVALRRCSMLLQCRSMLCPCVATHSWCVGRRTYSPHLGVGFCQPAELAVAYFLPGGEAAGTPTVDGQSLGQVLVGGR